MAGENPGCPQEHKPCREKVGGLCHNWHDAHEVITFSEGLLMCLLSPKWSQTTLLRSGKQHRRTQPQQRSGWFVCKGT